MIDMLQGAMEDDDPPVPARVHGRVVSGLPGRRPATAKVSFTSYLYLFVLTNKQFSMLFQLQLDKSFKYKNLLFVFELLRNGLTAFYKKMYIGTCI